MPCQFSTLDNQTWNLSLTFGIARKLKELTGIDVLDIRQAGRLPQLLLDRAKLADVLWFLVRGQAEERAVSQSAFEDSLDCDALQSGWEALAEVVKNFFPIQTRSAIDDAISEQLTAMEEAATKLSETIRSPELRKVVSQEIDNAIAKELKTFGQRR